MFSTRDLLTAGATPAEIKRARRAHKRVRRGVYAPTEELDHLLLCRAVLDGLKPGAALTGPSAAAVLGLPLPALPTDVVHVRNIARGSYAKDVWVMNGSVQTDWHDGFLLAEPAVVAADCARLLSARDALICADALLHEQRMDMSQLRLQAEAAKGSHGAARIRWLAEHADPAAESPGETWSRLVLRHLGFEPRSQVTVGDDVTFFRVDFLLDSVALEFDGTVKYRDPEGMSTVAKIITEKERRAHLQALGFTVLEIIWRQLHDPARLRTRLHHAGVEPTVAPSHLPAGWPLLSPPRRGVS